MVTNGGPGTHDRVDQAASVAVVPLSSMSTASTDGWQYPLIPKARSGSSTGAVVPASAAAGPDLWFAVLAFL